MGITISIINNKGGVGKTALACNLGAALSRMKQKVLIVDNDPQSNASVNILQGSSADQKCTLYELLDPDNKNDAPLKDCIYLSPQQKNLYCLPNVRATSGLDMELVSNYPASLNILRNKLKDYAEKTFDFTIIDTPPNIGIFTTIALCTSQFVIVPIDSSAADSLDGLQEALNLVDSVRKTDNPDLKFLRLLINRVHGHKTICKVIIEDIRKRFTTSQRFETMIPDATSIQQAVYMRETIFTTNRTCKAARSFRNLAKELVTIIEEL